jgi:hypothetical protein
MAIVTEVGAAESELEAREKLADASRRSESGAEEIAPPNRERGICVGEAYFVIFLFSKSRTYPHFGSVD